MRAAVPALFAAGLIAGCGTGSDERDARAAVERFEAAIEARDGAGACDELSEETASKLEQSERTACDEAILSLELTPSREVVDASIWVTSGQVQLDGDTVFVDESSQGWKVSAAGCEPTSADEPYECELAD